jgi:hypothetical protein
MMQKNGVRTSSHPPPVLRFNETKKTESTISEQKPKILTAPDPTYSHPFPTPSLPVRLPPPTIQNGHLTDTELKSKVKTNGHHQTIRSHRLNGNVAIIDNHKKETIRSHRLYGNTTTTTNNNKKETLKSNQSSRWTSNDKHNGGISSSKHPPPRTII